MAISAKQIKDLREKTQAGIMDCKRALMECNGDFAAAEKKLKEMGLAAVAKRADRSTDFGRISIMQADNKLVMIEVTCETDFVASNAQFAELGNKLCALAIEKGYTEVTPDMEDLVKGLIATINENMLIKNFIVMDVPADSYVETYIHGDGSIGTAVEFTSKNSDDFKVPAFKDFAFKCALHVCASDPQYLSDKIVPKEFEAEQIEIFKKQVEALDKPEKVKQGIVHGKLAKFYKEICLNLQLFAIDNDEGFSFEKKLAEFNKANGTSISVKSYKRLRAGA